MSTSDRAGFARRALVLLSAAALIALASCALAPDHCLRMSDCGEGTACVEGRCVSAAPANDMLASASVEGGPASPPSSSDKPASPSASPSVDAASGTSDGATDASDGAMTDAASDR